MRTNVSRAPNTTGNSDDLIGSPLAIRATRAVFRVEFWAMMPAGRNPSSGAGYCGRSQQYQNDAGANSWRRGGECQRVRGWSVVTNGLNFPAGAKPRRRRDARWVVWISTRRGERQQYARAMNLYIDDLVITDVTDAYNAQEARQTQLASAVDSDHKVTQQGDTLSYIRSRTTALENGLKTTNSTVSQKADASAVPEPPQNT